MVGASLAAALAPLGLKLALIEAVPHDAASQPSFDERTTALSNGSRRILETLGVWPGVSSQAPRIRKIQVSDQGRFGFARIDAAEQGLTAMGYVVPNRALGIALWSRLQTNANVQVLCPAQVSRITAGEHAVSLQIAQGAATATLDCKLVVAADGVHSAVRSAFGVDAETRHYQQTATITTLLPQRFHDHAPSETFTCTAPLPLLPPDRSRCPLA